MKSFIGHLEGTQKAHHTIRSYKSDLLTFEKFLREGLNLQKNLKQRVSLLHLTENDFRIYPEYLKTLGYKRNSQRRKVLTARRLLRYLVKRKKIKGEFAEKVPAPDRMERIPLVLEGEQLLGAIKKMSTQTAIKKRNQLLLWFLFETGCQLSEASVLKWENLNAKKCEVEILGKRKRTLSVSKEWMNAVFSAQKIINPDQKYRSVFLGYNRYGVFSTGLSDRGFEVLLDSLGKELGLGENIAFVGMKGESLKKKWNLTPRLIRHSAVVYWAKNGLDATEIQARLGLRTQYSFRLYFPLIQHFKKKRQKLREQKS